MHQQLLVQELVEVLNAKVAVWKPLLCKLPAKAAESRRDGGEKPTQSLHEINVPHDKNMVNVFADSCIEQIIENSSIEILMGELIHIIDVEGTGSHQRVKVDSDEGSFECLSRFHSQDQVETCPQAESM
eukprot:Skav214148  [mRNA]  locus=scaffold1645:228900:229286:+ [translate_table: standard]